MKTAFLLKIPEKYVNLEIANNYRQKTKKIKENLFKVNVRDTPKSIIKLLQKPINFEIRMEELKNVKHLIETYEDLFYILKDFIDARITNENKKGKSPFWEYYNPKWDNQCSIRNRTLSEYLKELGFEVRLIGGLYILLDKKKIGGTHVWVDVKVDNKWIELDASNSPLYPTCSLVRMNVLKEWDKFDRDYWLKGIIEVDIW